MNQKSLKKQNGTRSWFEVAYCLTKELGPKDRFLRTHKLRVYRHRPALRCYFHEIAKVCDTRRYRDLFDTAQPQIYLAYEHVRLTNQQLEELWAPRDSNIVRSVGSPDGGLLDGEYQLQANDQLVVITEPPEPALLYQWGSHAAHQSYHVTTAKKRFPYHPRRWLRLHDLSPVVAGHPSELREKRTWELVRYYLEDRYGLHSDPLQKKANLEASHLVGARWEDWVAWETHGRKPGKLKTLDEHERLGVEDKIVLMRKPSPKGFLPYKPSDFFALEVRFGSEEDALQALIRQDPKIYEGSRANLPVGKRIHASLANTNKMIRPDLTKGESCGCCGSKWHFAEFCELHRTEAQKHKGRMIAPLPTGIPKVFFKPIAREEKSSLIDRGYKLYYDPEEQVSQEDRTLFVSTKDELPQAGVADNSCPNEIDTPELLDESARAFNERYTVNELETLADLPPTEPEHRFVVLFEKGANVNGPPVDRLPHTKCRFTAGNTSVLEILAHVLRIALVRRHRTFTIVFADWTGPLRANWYDEFIRVGDRYRGWDVAVPAGSSARGLNPFRANHEHGGGPELYSPNKTGMAITRWTFDAAIDLYKYLSVDHHREDELSHTPTFGQSIRSSSSWSLDQAHMQTMLEWEMFKMGRKRDWKICHCLLGRTSDDCAIN